MTRSWWSKLLLLVFFTGLSCVYVYPTIANLDLATTKFPFKQKINLGLDLQGGLYMVLGADFNKVFKEVITRDAASLQDRAKEKGIELTSVKTVTEGLPADDPHIAVEFNPAKRDELYNLIKNEFWRFRLADEKPGRFEVGIARDYRVEVRERTINQSIEVIRNRIDEFGVAEPSIASQGTDRLVVELPGVREIDRAKDLIGRTAKLEFKIVNDKAMGPAQVAELVAEIEKTNNLSYKEGQKFSEYVKKVNDFAKGKIPEGNEISFERTKNAAGQETSRIPYLLFSKTEVTGDELSDASVQFDQENRRPYVAFSLKPRGATQFEKLTGDHIQERLAIVLDNIVHSAPVIQTRIGGGHGQITLGRGDGDAVMKEAKDLAIVLRAGALPAQLEFLEQRVVGPSLGQDSINKGAFAAFIGAIAVFIFIAFYYRGSGLIAAFSLLLNVLFVLAILVGLEATLTLPGIAGIALTVGIAVDSNVVIYERIREELRLGKKAHGAIEAGFQKAFRTILDANVTNAAAAIVLLMYGTGPIKGFAVTMLIGIVTTLFTAVFVCRLIFDAYLRRMEIKGQESISI
ncbi:MAG: protein-export membrane protein SecD [Bdellovibrionales bacterium RIFOXYC1_FULL_54_43]|nr:MAG: protein-export membrane protein SecD [Bdellovibrionales bacterium RIFOXYC1_FULL_54_43]OFZ84121.1 MAG: protein-export membrane protein SecD [Bdellovibrionales bacterium RIFOXYD1_FULL_55_31]